MTPEIFMLLYGEQPRQNNFNGQMVQPVDISQFMANPYLPRMKPRMPLQEPRQQRRGTLNRDRLRELGAFDEELLWMLKHPQWIPKDWQM